MKENEMINAIMLQVLYALSKVNGDIASIKLINGGDHYSVHLELDFENETSAFDEEYNKLWKDMEADEKIQEEGKRLHVMTEETKNKIRDILKR